MNIKNKEIRAHARHLLDDNIFGKDWLKGAFMSAMISILSVFLAGLFYQWMQEIIVFLAIKAIFQQSIMLLHLARFLLTFMIPIILCAIIGPISVGTAAVHLDLLRDGEQIRIGKFFYGFKYFFSNTLLAIMYVLQVTLWSFFFIVPGIYVAYSYALVFHVRKDHPEYRWKQCFDESERLMDGNRWNLFKLQISHLGWFIVGLAFVGVGAFWAVPYLNTSVATFYEQVRLERDTI